MTIEDYISDHIDAEPELLHRLYRHTHLTRLYPRMCSGHIQGRMLVMLTRMIRPHRILELGTFTGYSTLCFAEGMPADATIDTVEVDDEFSDELRDLFESSGYGDRIALHIGDAEEVVAAMPGEEQYDLIFIDANKRRYAEYYRLALPRLAPGGYILADNTLWGNKVVGGPHTHDAQTEGMLAFNDLVAADDRVEKVILPIRDGLTIIRKKVSS